MRAENRVGIALYQRPFEQRLETGRATGKDAELHTAADQSQHIEPTVGGDLERRQRRRSHGPARQHRDVVTATRESPSRPFHDALDARHPVWREPVADDEHAHDQARRSCPMRENSAIISAGNSSLFTPSHCPTIWAHRRITASIFALSSSSPDNPAS